jgi:hypothetical protein
MRWWTKRLIALVIWLGVVTIVVGYFHVFLGKATPAQNGAISEAYGMAVGFGAAMVCAIYFFVRAFLEGFLRTDNVSWLSYWRDIWRRR